MLKNFLIVIYFVLIFFIVVFVLLQQGRGADAGMSFSSTKISHNIFGSKGSDSILFMLTLIFFISFLIVALTLTRVIIIENRKTHLGNISRDSNTVFESSKDPSKNSKKLLPKVLEAS